MFKTFEFEFIEARKYTIQGSGLTRWDAEQDAIKRFHRLQKSGELVATSVSRPRHDQGLQVTIGNTQRIC